MVSHFSFHYVQNSLNIHFGIERVYRRNKYSGNKSSSNSILLVVLAPLFCCLLFSAIFICYCDLDAHNSVLSNSSSGLDSAYDSALTVC
ncbi:hypothetical protein RchiOBHm_Chr2g0125481 [Rosa chinensis]|uniref:Uncharacterized protein n=1 Tax=Rosa chinensis TaxID=74649 RepID=A0A2P6RTK7_ROSCH|nr:hypothetical protein RchiOBHm_Chr2g0125481 [Rosa chinensis]